MSWEDEFEDLMADEVTREPYAGQDDYAQANYGSAMTVKCRIVYRPEVVRRTSGETAGAASEVVAKARIYCAGGQDWVWDLRDRITLPDGSQPEIIAAHQYPDEDGRHHQVVIV